MSHGISVDEEVFPKICALPPVFCFARGLEVKLVEPVICRAMAGLWMAILLPVAWRDSDCPPMTGDEIDAAPAEAPVLAMRMEGGRVAGSVLIEPSIVC